MGYTHYFDQKRPATTEEWENITTSFKKLLVITMVQGKGYHIQLETDDIAPPFIGAEYIQFNGIGDNGHETMFVLRDALGFYFCKTAHKPYDLAVMHLLLLMHHFAPGSWTISSDGTAAEWQPALDWINSLGLGTFTLPSGI